MISKLDTKGVDITVKVLKGKLVDTLELACKAADIDLILIEPRTNSIKEEVFLGKTLEKSSSKPKYHRLLFLMAINLNPLVKYYLQLNLQS